MNIDPSLKQALALAIIQRRRRDTELTRLQEECQSLKSQLNAATTDPLHHLATLSLNDQSPTNTTTTTIDTTEQWSSTLSTWQTTLNTLPPHHFNILLKLLHIHHHHRHSTNQPPPTQAMMHITPVTMACQFLTQLLLHSNSNNKEGEEEEEVKEEEKKQQQQQQKKKKQQQEGNHTATTTTTTMDYYYSLIDGVAGCVISLLQVPSALNIHMDMESFHQLVDQLLMEACSDTTVGIHNDDDDDGTTTTTTTTRDNSGGDVEYPPPPPPGDNHNNQQLAHHLLLTFLKAPLACMSVVKQSADAFSLTIQELLSATIMMESNDIPSYSRKSFTSTNNIDNTTDIDPVNDGGLTAPSSAVHEASPHNHHHHTTMSLSSPHDDANVHTLEVIIYQLKEIVGSGLSALPGWIIEQQQQQQDNNNNNNTNGDGEEGEEYASEDVWHHHHHHNNNNNNNNNANSSTSMVDIDNYLSELSHTVQEAVNSAKLLAYTHPAVSNGASRVAAQLMHALQIISTQGI